MEFIYKMAESIVNVISGSPETEKTNVREKETLERGQKFFDEITKHERRLEELEFGPIAQLTPLVIPFIACLTALMLMGICCCGLYCFLGRAGTIGRVTANFSKRGRKILKFCTGDLVEGLHRMKPKKVLGLFTRIS